MSVRIQDLDAILKEFYLGPIIESLNNQLEMVQMFTKSTLDWQGRQVVIPVHVARNTGTGYRAELGQLPTAGAQGYVNLNVTAKFLYGRFSLTGPAISTAKTTANSFATYVQSEMDGLVTDTKLKANQAMFTGGGCVGFLHETSAAVGPGTTGWVQYSFTGNKEIVTELINMQTSAGVIAATHIPVLSVDLVRLDTYQLVNANPGAADAVVCDADGTAAQLRIRTLGAGAAYQLATTGNYATMVKVTGWGDMLIAGLNTFTAYDTLGAGTNGLVKQRVDSENDGIYGNLGNVSHFGVDRSQAANASLRSTVQAISVGAHAHGNQALNFGRMQSILDELMVLGGDDPDCIYVHPGIRQKYADLLVFNAPGSIKKGAIGDVGTGDPGFSGYAFNGIPLKMSRHCGKGLMVFLKTKTWTIAELQSFGMADLDGNVLSRLSNQDAYEGFVRWYYNLVCKEPNRNAILCGIAFPA
jgi:hypothetical protein